MNVVRISKTLQFENDAIKIKPCWSVAQTRYMFLTKGENDFSDFEEGRELKQEPWENPAPSYQTINLSQSAVLQKYENQREEEIEIEIRGRRK